MHNNLFKAFGKLSGMTKVLLLLLLLVVVVVVITAVVKIVIVGYWLNVLFQFWVLFLGWFCFALNPFYPLLPCKTLKIILQGCLGGSVGCVWLSISAQVLISGAWDWAPHQALLWVWNLLKIPSHPLPLPPTSTSLTLSK